MRDEVTEMRELANKAQGTWNKFRKERDFHRMHHKRVVQEKEKLVKDIRRLKSTLPDTASAQNHPGKIRGCNEGKNASET